MLMPAAQHWARVKARQDGKVKGQRTPQQQHGKLLHNAFLVHGARLRQNAAPARAGSQPYIGYTLPSASPVIDPGTQRCEHRRHETIVAWRTPHRIARISLLVPEHGVFSLRKSRGLQA